MRIIYVCMPSAYVTRQECKSTVASHTVHRLSYMAMRRPADTVEFLTEEECCNTHPDIQSMGTLKSTSCGV